MDNLAQITEISRGVNDYGMLAVTSAFYLVLTAIMMVTLFKWFKSIINQILDQNRKGMKEVLSETRKQNDLLQDLAEGLRTETQLRLRNISSFAFDLSVEQVCRLIKQVREENNLEHREATKAKIHKRIRNIHEDRNSRFDPFTFHGKGISRYCNPEWIDKVSSVVEGEIYNEKEPDDSRAYAAIKAAYDEIKIDFYHRLNGINDK